MYKMEQLVLSEDNIIFNPMLGNSYQLNDISKEIIVMLKEQKTKEEIIKELSKTYQVSKSDLFIDVSDFLSKLKIYGLIS